VTVVVSMMSYILQRPTSKPLLSPRYETLCGSLSQDTYDIYSHQQLIDRTLLYEKRLSSRSPQERKMIILLRRESRKFIRCEIHSSNGFIHFYLCNFSGV